MNKLLALIIAFTLITPVYANQLKASWYSVESLKREGTWKTNKGVMANGHQFKDTDYTCASRMHKLGSVLRVTNVRNNKSVIVKVTDRIGYRFKDTRIDLSKQAFKEIADLDEGVITVSVDNKQYLTPSNMEER